ncbi:MAG: hypothetical protein ACPGTP_08905 [Bacteroidia bacterium]
MGRSTFIIVFVSLIVLIAAVVPEERQFDIVLDSSPKDSTELKKTEIYICKGHYFEWCTESSTCAHCNEYLEKINLWEYYQLLECEDCQKFFEENYSNFIGEEPQL